jgi:hypothetical protein
MANHQAIYSVCQSLADYLNQAHAAFVEQNAGETAASFEVVGSADFASEKVIGDNTVLVYLHRVTINNHLRNTRPRGELAPLGLDLHLLLSFWGASPEKEHKLLAWTLRQLHFHAFLDASSLIPAGWTGDEQITLFPGELTAEELARIWDVARRPQRLAFPYVARIVRLGFDPTPDAAPVLLRRLSHTDDLQETQP